MTFYLHFDFSFCPFFFAMKWNCFTVLYKMQNRSTFFLCNFCCSKWGIKIWVGNCTELLPGMSGKFVKALYLSFVDIYEYTFRRCIQSCTQHIISRERECSSDFFGEEWLLNIFCFVLSLGYNTIYRKNLLFILSILLCLMHG